MSCSMAEAVPEATILSRDPAPGSPRLTKGRLELVFAPDAEGRSFLARQFASYPFHVCRAQYLDAELPEMASLYLQSSAGGLFAGDRLGVSITCKPNAMAHVTTQASTIADPMPEEEAVLMLNLALDAGINLVDTGDVYADGERESTIGRTLKANGRREQVLFATKVDHTKLGKHPNDYGHSRLNIIRACEGSLRRLQTDYIDL